MQHGDRLAQERRARLAAELMLEQVQAELSAANHKIAATNRNLSDEIVVKREEVQQVRSVAESLRDENLEVKTSLERAESAIMIAERRLWDSLETIQDGFAVFDAERVMVAANRAYIAAFDGLEMIGPGVHYHEMLKIMCEEGIVDLEDTPPEDWRLMMAARWDSDRVEPVTVKLWNGAFIKVIDRRTRDGDMVSLGLNITSTIRREAELERARARAEAANRAKSAFLANMSHEIRTPMNGVIGMADMLSETGLDEEQRLFVETIRNSGEALLVIINDVLDYSKIEAKKLELHPSRFDLERCIHEVLMLLQPSAHDKGLQLAVDYDMFMPTEFVGDPGRVRQILTNLAGNAVKFTEAGHVAIRVVGLPVRDGAAYRVHVTVEDTGIGIPDEKLRTIFGEFNQVEDERNRRYDGTGLGLAITKRLVEMMEGEVWVDSEVNAGSGFGFHITMPVAEGAATPPISAPDWIERAIVVDEPQMTRAILTKQLAAMGLHALSARAGADLEALAPTACDVIILGDVGIAQQLAPWLSRPGAPQAVALLSSPLAGVTLPGVTAAIQKPAQRREIARVLATLSAPPERPTDAGDPEERVATSEAHPGALVAEAPVLTEPGAGPAEITASELAVDPRAADARAAEPATVPAQQADAPTLRSTGAADISTETGTREEMTDFAPLSEEPFASVSAGDSAAEVAPLHGPEAPRAAPVDAGNGMSEEEVAEIPPFAATATHVFELGHASASVMCGAFAGEPSVWESGSLSSPPVSDPAETPLAPEFPAAAGGPAPPGPEPVSTAWGAAGVAQASAGFPAPVEPTGPPLPAPLPGGLDALPAPEGPPPALAPTAADNFAVLQPPVPEPPARPDVATDVARNAPDAETGSASPQAIPTMAPVPGSPAQGPDTSFGARAAAPRRMRVLAAEDNKTNRLVFSKMVQSLDIDLVFAVNGREAVAAFEAEVPDLIFTDISMPEMDGKEASRRIRRIEAARALPRTPIVAITAHAMAGDAEEILAAGIDGYLTKPLKRSALVEAIRSARPVGVRDPMGEPLAPDMAAGAESAPALAPLSAEPVAEATPLARTAAE